MKLLHSDSLSRFDDYEVKTTAALASEDKTNML